jgi:hypothetical protein
VEVEAGAATVIEFSNKKLQKNQERSCAVVDAGAGRGNMRRKQSEAK